MTRKLTEIAWAAGIIDGEGCLFISRHAYGSYTKTPNYTAALKVTMGHEPTVKRIRELFDSGSHHRVEQSNKGFNTAYTWIVAAKLLRPVLLALKPFCITKAAEIDVALEFLALPKWYGGQFRGPKSKKYQRTEYELWDRMRRLKPRTALRLARERKEKRNGKNMLRPKNV